MNSKSRIKAVLHTENLGTSVTGFPNFQLSELAVHSELDFKLPTNLRLGHLAEKIVSYCIKSATNFKLLHENIQIKKNKNTVGEIDFIIENNHTKQLIHLELAYKFYLYDPSISTEIINNWIGPNRKDSLKEKLDKLKQKQFPLLHREVTKTTLSITETDKISQQLCLLASLYIPYEYNIEFSPAYRKAIKGYYIDFKTFKNLNTSKKTYYLPTKKEWGMNPSQHTVWSEFNDVEETILEMLHQKHSPLCWQKHNAIYEEFFIVFW
ncbi:DUF1853 family protein [Kordia algicida OT-1]|uniref:DUF1853 family protein n=1 Tax=Kordia algicida OT-1 TaxID=391587 RepID=A9E4E3_9FLAO|nr:DUF1853 family protein [Kordia algicida]EDP95354.1 hypothetical protein KAOT1_09786 [Kordia algicida OT-1]